MPKIDVKALTDGIGLLSAALPQLAAAYAAYRVIWTMTHPGATEDEYIAHLEDASKANVDAAAVILTAHGWTKDTAGNWVKPAA